MFQGPRPYIVAARYFGDIDFSHQVYDCTSHQLVYGQISVLLH